LLVHTNQPLSRRGYPPSWVARRWSALCFAADLNFRWPSAGGSLLRLSDVARCVCVRALCSDFRSDIWAVGATMYQMLTGRPPFEAPPGQPRRNIIGIVLYDKTPTKDVRMVRLVSPCVVSQLVLHMLTECACSSPGSADCEARACVGDQDKPPRPG